MKQKSKTEDECISCTVYFQQSVVYWVYYVIALSKWWIIVVGLLGNDCSTSTEPDRVCCCRLCLLFVWFISASCLPFICHSSLPWFVCEYCKDASRRAKSRQTELFWHSWHKVDGRGNSKLLSSGQRCFIFSLISGVLCGCPILLTHQPWGDWFGVSCWDLESWP